MSISYTLTEQIQLEVNRSTQYRTDLDLYQKLEHWTPARLQGDCEDYALAKRAKLLQAGADPKHLRLALCWTETQEYHAVLIVTTDQGDYVLDNRYPFPMVRQDLNYTWDRIQEGNQWYRVS